MKLLNLVWVVLMVVGVSSCKKQSVSTNETKDVSIRVNNKVGNNALSFGNLVHQNAAGDMYSIDMLKYFMSNMVLKADNGNEVKYNNYELIDASDEASMWLPLKELPYGKYTSLKFNLGIDSVRNHSGPQDGDLDTKNGMIWTWNTGYIFLKLEGQYKVGSNPQSDLVFHLGTDKALSTIEIPINWEINENSKYLYIDFDVNKMFNSPVINFTEDNDRQSTSVDDAHWITNMVANMNDVFSFNRTE